MDKNKTNKGNNKKLIFSIIILLVLGCFWIYYAHYQYNEPLRVTEKVLEEAKECLAVSEYVLTKDEWSRWEEQSEYSEALRKNFSWEKFKELVNQPEGVISVIDLGSTSLLETIINRNREKAYCLIEVLIYDEYYKNDEYNASIERNIVTLCLKVVEGDWKVIGSLSNLESLNYLDLRNNQIRDISLLKELKNLDEILLRNNLLNLSEGSPSMETIKVLEDRGVTVSI